MRELMLELLTYEPFEKIKKDEKKYIDAVLAGDTALSKQYPLYDELMDAYKKYYDAGNFDDTSSLVGWFKKYYIITQKGNIDVLSYRSNGVRAYYPVLFKKICICGLLYSQLANNTRDGHSNADFFEKFGMRENILNKWHVSTRYLFLANRDTYSSFRIDRSGLKKVHEIESHYVWNDELCDEKEILIWLKTEECLYNCVEELLKNIHPYDTPEIISIPIDNVSDSYAEWVHESVMQRGDKL